MRKTLLPVFMIIRGGRLTRKYTITFLIIACIIASLQTRSQRLSADFPEGTAITESGTFMGSLSDTGLKTSFPQMPFSYHDWDFFWIELSLFDILAF
jgi:hypothetical protein